MKKRVYSKYSVLENMFLAFIFIEISSLKLEKEISSQCLDWQNFRDSLIVTIFINLTCL